MNAFMQAGDALAMHVHLVGSVPMSSADGVEGTRKRLAAAWRNIKDFSVATECGFGRRKSETIPELLRIHAEVAAS